MPPVPQSRLPAEERTAQILAAAAELFAEEGFGIGTRTLAQRLGVTQALLYRYFPSKEALVEAVIDRLARGRWQESWSALLAAREPGLEERLTRFYAAYLGGITPVGMRLFVRANLEGEALARRFAVPLTGRLLAGVAGALRDACALPGLDAQPLLEAERELAMSLHGGVMFLAVRKHVYRMPMTGERDRLAALQVRVWLPGALAEMRRLHADAAALAVEQLKPRGQ